MDRITHIEDQQPEKTANPAKKATTRTPRPWERKQYIYQESSTDDGRSSHCDPRLELAQRLHQDSGIIPSDDDSESLHPALGLGATSDLKASAFFASELGTLAGGFTSFSAPQLGKRPRTNGSVHAAVLRRGTRSERQHLRNGGYYRHYQE
jgi:hypothetical protein